MATPLAHDALSWATTGLAALCKTWNCSPDQVTELTIYADRNQCIVIGLAIITTAITPALDELVDDNRCDCDDEGCPECDNRHAAAQSHEEPGNAILGLEIQ